MAPKLVRVEIVTPDLEAAAEAWRQASGLAPERGESGLGQATMRVGEVVLALLGGDDGRGEGLAGLTLEVEDIEVALAQLVANGARIAGEEMPPDAGLSVTLDPDSTCGVPITLVPRS